MLDKNTNNINFKIEMIHGENIEIKVNVPKMMEMFKQNIIEIQEQVEEYPSTYLQDLIRAGNLDESILQYVDLEINYLYEDLSNILRDNKEDWRPSNYEDEKKVIFKIINDKVCTDIESFIVLHAVDNMLKNSLNY